MNRRHVVLVNENQMQPPVTPIGLDYIGDTLIEADYEVELVDLTFANENELTDTLSAGDPIVVGVSFRNSDDCFWPSATSFVPRLRDLVARIRAATEATIVLGGSGSHKTFKRNGLRFSACRADPAWAAGRAPML